MGRGGGRCSRRQHPQSLLGEGSRQLSAEATPSHSPVGAQPGVRKVGGLPGCSVQGREGEDGDWTVASALGWKLNPVVGAVYGPEFYAGKCRTVGDRGGACWALGGRHWPGRAGGRGGVAGAWPASGVGGPAWGGPHAWSSRHVARGRDRAWPRPRLPLPHRLLSRPLSCSDGVPLPHHRHSRGLQGRALTRPGPGCVQHVSGRAAPAPHPDLRSVSVWGPKGREVWRKVRGAQGGRPAQPEGLGSLSITGGVRCGAPQTSTQQRPAAGNQGPLACREHLGPQPEAVVGRGRPWRPARPCPRPSRTIAPGPVPPPPRGGRLPREERGRESQAGGPLGLLQKGAGQQGGHCIVIPKQGAGANAC